MLKKLWDLIQQARLSRTDYARWKGVKIGKDCRIITRTFGTEPFLIEIGDRVTVAANVAFLTHDGATWLLRDERGRKQHYAPIRIGSDCFVGYGAIILPGVEIGDRVIVGAGSVVTKSVPANSVVAGNPARHICTFDEWARKPFRHEAEAMGDTFEERVLSLAA
jgi:acetyltransferase-like isoleucine patch superfamily enzyme